MIDHSSGFVNPTGNFSNGEIPDYLKNRYYLPVVLNVTPEEETRAWEIAAGRQQGKETRQACHDRGSYAANLEADYWGALGELLIFDALRSMNLRFEAAPLVSQYAVPKADLVLDRVRFDIKAVPLGKGFVTINARQHEQCRCHFYAPVHFTGRRQARVCTPLPHNAISAWSLRDDRHSPYFSAAASDLEPLYTWMQFIEREVAA